MTLLQNNLKNQIALLCVTLIFICSSTIMISFWWYSSRYNEQQIEIDLTQAHNVFEQYLSAQEKLLLAATGLLAEDTGFQRAAVNTDSRTVNTLLRKHGERIDADLMLLTRLNGQVIGAEPESVDTSLALADTVQALMQVPGSARFVALHGSLYRVALMPVNAPRKVGYVIVGFAINRSVTEDLRQLTDLDVSFIAHDQGFIVSSLPAADTPSLNHTLNSRVDHLVVWQRPNFISRTLSVSSLASEPVTLILTASLPKLYAEFDRVINITLLWATVTLLIGLIAALFLSRTLIVPLRQLVTTAKMFAVGDYRSHFETTTTTSSEVRDLFNAFTEMGQQIKAREEQVLFQARHDILTQLYNRSTMLDVIAGHINLQQPFVLIASNIREFKSINDNLGPQTGDQCLRAIAERLLETAEENNSLHARLGGDEFISLIPLIKLKSADKIANKLLSLLHRPVMVHELHLQLRFCLGVCVFPDDGEDAKTLVRRTIIALEDAHKKGLPIRHYEQGEDEAHLERLAMVDALTKAMRADDGQLFMHYQPKLNVKSGCIEKVESLIRWQRPGHGLVSPELFIGLAEQAGLIVELTQWVVRTVLSQLNAWKEQGVDIKAAINISAQDLLHPDFVPFMQHSVHQYHIHPSSVTLELTERDLMRDEEQGLTVLIQLQRLGFTLSVDDYGIGQSSLGKLKKLPVTELKIDKSFILKLDSSPTDQMIVQSTINLGHNLGLSVVAEGVENEASLALLKSMGVDHIQGFLLCRPIAEDDFISWLAHRSGHPQQA